MSNYECDVTFGWGPEGKRYFALRDGVGVWTIQQPYTLTCGGGECYGPQVPKCSWKDKSSTAELVFTLADVGITLSDACKEALEKKCFHNSANFFEQEKCIRDLGGPGEACDGEAFWPKEGIPDFAYLDSVSIPYCACEVTIGIDGSSLSRSGKEPSRQDMHNLNQQIKQEYQRNLRRQLNN